ncbi:LysR family transcriptional regulator [Streptomyces sp. NPDC056669]|uniref:helix-turn-helix domain-containing protein n=1 Tax=unclassified Streptomyces TaxID=2593676 RepID=UPI0036A3AE5A
MANSPWGGPGEGGSSADLDLAGRCDEGVHRRRSLSCCGASTTSHAATEGATLTTRIIRLERDLGRPLLERAERGRGMRLTPFGRRVADAARSAASARA